MGAVLNRSVATNGVIAYQDSDRATLFHYIPARIDAQIGDTINSFQVVYYGINEKPYMVDFGNNLFESCVGGVLSGKCTPDITAAQKDAIKEQIAEHFAIDAPTLTPLEIKNVSVQPVFAKSIAEMGQGSNFNFPTTVKFGTSFNYSIASGNSLFAEMAGAQMEESKQASRPDFAINISGLGTFYGDPWSAEISCNLTEVWEYMRLKVKAGIGLGWIQLGTDIDKIAQSLIKDGTIKITYREGTGGVEFGRQLLESTKTVFEAINQQAVSGEGFFRFEPNPEPQQPADPDTSWGASLLPWTTSINVGYGENAFTQAITFNQTVSFTGTLDVPIVSSMNLALPCTSSTRQYFFDQQIQKNGCVDKAKSEALQKRLRAEATAKNEELKSLYNDVKAGRITTKEYTELKALLNTFTYTDNPQFTVEQIRSRFEAVRQGVARLRQAAVAA